MIPVTLLTGFLGSGKTTLIQNHLTQAAPTEKWIVIENEFGPINLDAQFLGTKDDLTIVELTNGCVCCSVQGELTEALYQLLDSHLADPSAFDRVIIETTGVADPGPVIQLFFIDERLKSSFKLDGVITVVDSEHVLTQLAAHRVVYAQIGFADRLILTKTDRISSEVFDEVVDRLHRINAKAPLIEAIHGDLPAECWLNICSFDLNDDFTLSTGVFKMTSLTPTQQTLQLKPFSNALRTTAVEPDLRSFLLTASDLPLKEAGAFMEQLIERYGNDMMRYKGIFAIAGEPRKLIVQGVHKVVGFDYGEVWRDDEARLSQLVIIGWTLPQESLQTTFSALSSPTTAL